MSERSSDVKILEHVGDVAILKLPVVGFDALSLHEKLVAYHLWYASVCGDPITYEQNYRFGLRLRDFFLDLLSCKKVLSGSDLAKLELYTKRLLLHHGNHDAWSTRKFLPGFTKNDLDRMILAAKAIGFSKKLDTHFERAIFDPEFESMLTQKSPGPGDDIITASHTTFYQDITLNDLEGFTDQFPNNSNVIKRGDAIIEDVWRAGSPGKGIKPGVYAFYLKNVAQHLVNAARYAPEHQRVALDLLTRYLEEGDPSLFDEFNKVWLADNPQVDSIIGFIEEYRDTRGKKGLFEGMSFFKDEKNTQIILKVAQASPKLEEMTPWNSQYRKHWDKIPVANAITLIAGTGGSGPFCWAGVNLPNANNIREQYGSKSIILANVTFASRHAFAEKSFKEFLEKKEDIQAALKYLDIKGPVMVTLHEIVGHGSGKMQEGMLKDPHHYLREYYSTLEEARAELCALHHIHNPLLQELGVVPDDECWKSVYIGYATLGITGLRSLDHETELHEDHFRATQLIVEYLRRKTHAIEFHITKGKTYARVIDYEQMKQGVAELLAELQRIKSEGDYEAIKHLVEEYGVHFDLKLRDEVVKRAQTINHPAFYAYVMAEPKLIKDPSGNITDVTLEYPDGLLEQGRRWRTIGG